MALAKNPLWGAPRIHVELLKLGIGISEREVSRLKPPAPRKPPSQTWRTFLTNYLGSFASIDFFPVPTATLRVLYVSVVSAHDRRRVLHFNVTEHLTACWTTQQIVEAFPEASPPQYMMRDRDQTLRVGGHLTDVGVTSEGTIVAEEERIAVEDLPAAVAKAFAASPLGRRHVERVERVVEGEHRLDPRFEILVQNGSISVELTFDATGHLVKYEEIRHAPSGRRPAKRTTTTPTD